MARGSRLPARTSMLYSEGPGNRPALPAPVSHPIPDRVLQAARGGISQPVWQVSNGSPPSGRPVTQNHQGSRPAPGNGRCRETHAERPPSHRAGGGISKPVALSLSVHGHLEQCEGRSPPIQGGREVAEDKAVYG